jgi:RNA polymerase sigma factor (sigma-70 family)
VFYRRHVRAILTYLLSRTERHEVAADVCAEVFASAFEMADRYDARRGSARAWLITVARSRLVDSARRGRVADDARRRLAMSPLVFSDDDIRRVEEIVDIDHGLGAERLVEDLPPEQREAVLARIVDERDYADIASSLMCSEAVVRKRVSRGLATLRARLRDAT